MDNKDRVAATAFQWRNSFASRGELVEEFRRFAESIEWRVGQNYLRTSGAKSFVSDSSPRVSTNEGEGSFVHLRGFAHLVCHVFDARQALFGAAVPDGLDPADVACGAVRPAPMEGDVF